MGREEQVAALSKLMLDGVFNAEEFTRLISALDGSSQLPAVEKTPAQKTYENYIMNVVARGFKSPSAVKFPPFEASMVKQGLIKLDMREQNVRYIETYVDAPNSYGTMLREPIIIGIDDDFNPLYWAQHVYLGALLGKEKGWTTMARTK